MNYMGTSKNKVRLSPRLRLGVGRGYSKNNILKYSGFLFLLVSVALGGWTIYVITSHVNSPGQASPNPQVLGATDTQTPPSTFITITIAKGDTIFNIAQKYKVEWTTLATINNITSPFALKIGQKLKVPQQ